MEVCLPPPTLKYLAVSDAVLQCLCLIYNCLKNVKSIQNSALNLLTAVSLFNNGVREILPFVYVYMLQFIRQSENHLPMTPVVTFLSFLTSSGVPYKVKTKAKGWSVRQPGYALLH